ncbi:MAG: hypothetical protein H7196_04330 [candidate division SR1 bacterium]|nr:hypothetical protein [candidate division SR1 bacterium]
MKTIHYDSELAPNNVKKDHQQAFNILKLEDKQRYFQYVSKTNIVTKNFCNRFNLPFKNYQIFLRDVEMTGGEYMVGERSKEYLENTSSDNYVRITNKVVENFDNVELLITMVHEYLGHALMTNTDMKTGKTLSLIQSGPSFRKLRTYEAQFNCSILNKIKVKISKDEDLDDVEEEIMKSFMFEEDGYNNYPPLIKRAEAALITNPEQKITIKVRTTIGRELDEGITDYFAIKLCTDSEEQFEEYKNSERAYTQFINNILIIKKFIQDHSSFSNNDFEQMLVDVKKTNNVGEMAKIISEKTKIKIPVTALFQNPILLDIYVNN